MAALASTATMHMITDYSIKLYIIKISRRINSDPDTFFPAAERAFLHFQTVHCSALPFRNLIQFQDPRHHRIADSLHRILADEAQVSSGRVGPGEGSTHIR